jgi:ABC-2 type transport system ATP-binding protein
MDGADRVRNVISDLAIETIGLGKRYGAVWALQDCSLAVPKGRVSALFGPNGAGKTTLLRMLVGLSSPSAGSATILGRGPQQSIEFLADIGYLAQDVPLYKRLSANEHLACGARLNREWDMDRAKARLDALRVPRDRPVSTLSGGQRAQVGLSLTLAKKPKVLFLDEPVAALDPLARREFLGTLSAAVADAEGELSIVLSSHLVHDIEQVCDHLIILSSSRAQLCDDLDRVLETHRMLSGPRQSTARLERSFEVVHATHTASQTRMLVRMEGPLLDPGWEVEEVGVEEIVLAYMQQDEPTDTRVLVGLGAES